ncbi:MULTISPECIES: hypothetical protein [Serratia]|uniref:hypothetical protein n=1 Tax=Serratia TaxID=613 RepID=UPI000745528F|nr:hypothetical protein [Serratia marcescens]CVA12636.1 Uncharacterised protein [Serratia marcescens]CVA90952.1 Uncharacterised protein [Serratia marcescens]CVB31562.1 Uncharacterised protein [Serratia marcescens]CVB55961.1 Uncharacterised protein [Serratia marcescens]CVB92142.1 Uncharacterised protein [Serratia marcescens]
MEKVKFLEMKIRFYVTKDGAIKQDIDSKFMKTEMAKEFSEKYIKAFVELQGGLVADVSKAVIGNDTKSFH